MIPSATTYSYFQHFYQNNKVHLEKFYPGINPSVLYRFYADFIKGLTEQPGNHKSIYSDEFLSLQKDSLLFDFLEKVKQGIPLQYITGQASFYGLEFFVNQNVLIPRPETELLIEKILDRTKDLREDFSFIDIGTGSGCIALSLLATFNFPVKGVATDIDPDALSVARTNYFKLGFHLSDESELDFKLGDRLTGVTNESFNLVVSNPPYIMRNKDFSKVHQQVELYEPARALYLPDEEYFSWFEQLFKQGHFALKSNGLLALEGSEKHLEKVERIAIDCGFIETKLEKDLTGRLRFLFAKKDG